MSDEVTQTILLLSDPKIPLTAQARPMVTRIANTLAQSELDQSNIEILKTHLGNGRKTKDLYKAIVIESLLFAIDKKPDYSSRLRDLILKYKPSFEEANGILTSVMWQNFNETLVSDKNLARHCGREVQKHLFDICVDYGKSYVAEELNNETLTFERNNKVLVVTKQMQMPPHAPSVRTLEFSRNLIEDYGKEVVILCSSEVSSKNPAPYIPQSTGNYAEPFLNVNNVTYEGHNIPFAMCGGSVFSETAIRQAIQLVAKFNPEMILSIGAPSLIGELFEGSIFSFFYMSGHGVPITQHHYFHTWDEPSETEKAILKNEEIADQHRFVSTPGYHKRVQYQKLNKSDFDLPEDVFIYAIIGMRLNSEVDNSFLDVLQQITNQTNAHFIFAGSFSDFDEILDKTPGVKARSRFLGMQPDIMAVYEMADAYLNPERKGGGSSAAQALQADLPVLSLPTGDVGFMVKNFPRLENYDELATRAVELIENNETYNQYQNITKAGSDRISVRNEYLGKIMAEFETFADENLKKQAKEKPA